MSHRTMPFLALILLIAGSAPGDEKQPPDPRKQPQEQAIFKHLRLKRDYQDWMKQVVVTKERVEESKDSEDRVWKAGLLTQAIEKAKDRNISKKMDLLLIRLENPKAFSTLEEVQKLAEQQGEIGRFLQEVLVILLIDPDEVKLRQRNEVLNQHLQQLREVIQEQTRLRESTLDKEPPTAALLATQKKTVQKFLAVAKSLPQDLDKEMQEISKHLVNARKSMEQAQGLLEKAERPNAADAQAVTIEHLRLAVKVFQQHVDRKKEEEKGFRLSPLEARFLKMNPMQQEVREGILKLDKSLRDNPDKKPTAEQVQQGLKLAEQQQRIIREVDKVLALLEVEGAAVAFPEVLRQVRDDMETVQRRLSKTDTDKITQAIAKDVCETIEEMIQALSKSPGKPAKPLKPREVKEVFPELVERLVDIVAAQRKQQEEFQALIKELRSKIEK